MKNITLHILLIGILAFITGCSNKTGMQINNSSVKEVKEFVKGTVLSSKKVLVKESKISALEGVGAGALAGAAIKSKGNKKNIATGAAIGAVVGAAVSYFSNNEVVAYETDVLSEEGNKYTIYLQHKVSEGVKIDFIKRENGDITNVNVIMD
jgi:outer membrane lipoprotein SlyB